MRIHLVKAIAKGACFMVAVILASLVLLRATASAQDGSAEALFKQAEAADQAGNLSGAIELYTKLVNQYPGAAAGHANLGVALAHAGRMDEAAAQYTQALKLDPGNPGISVDFGILRYKEAQYADAAGILEPVVNAHPEKGQPLFLLADCYLRLGKFRESIALLDPIYAQDATDRTVSYFLGMALISSGDVDRGSVVIDRAMRDGGSAIADLLIGAKLLATGDHHGAAIALTRATVDNPNSPSGWSLLGRALLDEEDFAGAQKAFHRALDGDPNDFDANLYLGGMLRSDAKFEEALPYLQKAFSLRPDSPQAAYQMGAIEAARGDLDKALGFLEPVEKKWPEFQQVHVQLALIYQKQHRIEESRREREAVVELDEKARRQRKQMPAPE